MTICKVANCEGIVFAKGWCSSHYQRWRRHGSPFKGRKTYNGEPEKFIQKAFYWNSKNCLIWPFHCHPKFGYASIGKNTRVSRIVCKKIHGCAPTKKHEAAHSCGKGHLGCISPLHLSWKTHFENMQDMIAHGTVARGTKIKSSKLDEEQVIEIRSRKGKELQRITALEFGIGQDQVSRIQTSHRWSWLL